MIFNLFISSCQETPIMEEKDDVKSPLKTNPPETPTS